MDRVVRQDHESDILVSIGALNKSTGRFASVTMLARACCPCCTLQLELEQAFLGMEAQGRMEERRNPD